MQGLRNFAGGVADVAGYAWNKAREAKNYVGRITVSSRTYDGGVHTRVRTVSDVVGENRMTILSIIGFLGTYGIMHLLKELEQGSGALNAIDSSIKWLVTTDGKVDLVKLAAVLLAAQVVGRPAINFVGEKAFSGAKAVGRGLQSGMHAAGAKINAWQTERRERAKLEAAQKKLENDSNKDPI